MSWLHYLAAVIVFTVVGFASLMAILMTQQWLPFNPMALANLSWHLAFNTAWSFTCNADWQSYMGEATMSYFSQTVGLSVHQFLSGAGVDTNTHLVAYDQDKSMFAARLFATKDRKLRTLARSLGCGRPVGVSRS